MVPPEANAFFDMPVSAEELQTEVQQDKMNKAPGYAGICHDFYKLAWAIIKDELLVVQHHM